MSSVDLNSSFQELENDSPPSPNSSLPDDYLRWAGAIVVVYSITSRKSFTVAKAYLEAISQFTRESSRPDIPVALVGNKVDLERYRYL
jgi:GTPase SAR1 family protein